MGIFSWLSRSQGAEALAPGRSAHLSSPWGPRLSTSIMAADWLGSANLPVTYDQAMRVPAVVAARNLICESLAGGVLEAWRGDGKLASQPSWLYRTDSDMPPQRRLAWTVDDLLFAGYSIWAVDRSSSGQIGDAVRVPAERWDWDTDWNVLIDGERVGARDVIVFTGRDQGLLLTGNDVVRQYLDIMRAVTTRVRVPSAHTLLVEQQQNLGLTDEQQDQVVDQFIAARQRQDTGAVSYVPFGIKPEEFGKADPGLFEQGRNAGVLEIARLTGIPATLLDASGVAASLTYESTQANRVILNDRLRQWAGLIDSRLSMDDCTPRGTRVALDLSHLTGPDTGLPASTED